MAPQRMINIEESNNIISQINPLSRTERIPLSQCLGRILAEDVVADVDQPPFDKSAMDGYACRYSDLGAPLHCMGIIAAGTMVEQPLNEGECYRIFTGAPVPPGADCVIMQEDTELNKDGKVIFKALQTKKNICYKGEDGKAGDIALKKGTFLQAQHLAILASYGIINPTVNKKIAVSVFCSGSELTEPENKPTKAIIRNSNAAQLTGQLVRTGAEATYKGIVPDDGNIVCESILSELPNCDVLVITGGASVGDFDFIPQILTHLKAEIKIPALNIQPGKPVILARLDDKFIVGLSGNPVSSFLQYKLITEPLILKLSGADNFLPKYIQIPLKENIIRKKGNRQLYTPVKISSEGFAVPLPFNGSAHIGALTDAHGFAVMKPGINSLNKSDLTDIILI